jgi:hypothetical protein
MNINQNVVTRLKMLVIGDLFIFFTLISLLKAYSSLCLYMFAL